jgi:hypothetical protein
MKIEQKDIEFFNNLIARFVNQEVKFESWSYEYGKGLYKSGTTVIPLEHYHWKDKLAFHYNLDWLMYALTKIEETGLIDEFVVKYDSDEKGTYAYITPLHKNSFLTFKSEIYQSKINAIYEVVIKFIEWYQNR